MTYEEAIEILRRNKPTADAIKCGTELCAAVDIAVEAIDRRIPKKPYLSGDGYDTWECPCCRVQFETETEEACCCPDCGQAIDWSDSD